MDNKGTKVGGWYTNPDTKEVNHRRTGAKNGRQLRMAKRREAEERNARTAAHHPEPIGGEVMDNNWGK